MVGRRSATANEGSTAALVTYEVTLCVEDEIGVLSSYVSREWVKSLVQDPEALMRLLVLIQRKETEEAERSLSALPPRRGVGE